MDKDILLNQTIGAVIGGVPLPPPSATIAIHSTSIQRDYSDSTGNTVILTVNFDCQATAWISKITVKGTSYETAQQTISGGESMLTYTATLRIGGAVNGYLSLNFIVKLLRNGVWTDYSPSVFVTNEVEPTGYDSTYPAYMTPDTHTQYVWDIDTGNYNGQVPGCLANALAAAMQVIVRKYTKISGIKFSPAWIFGNRSSDPVGSDTGLTLSEALSKLISDGVPSWMDLNEGARPRYYPDNLYYYNWGSNIGAKQLVQNNYSSVIKKANFNRLEGYTMLDPAMSNINTVKQAIIDYGCVLMILNVTEINSEFYSIGSNGIVPQPDYLPNYNNNHALVIMGWTHINGIAYWYCRNSWGTNWGASGGCYIPMNYVAMEQYVILKPAYAFWTYWSKNVASGKEFKSIVTANYFNQFIDYVKKIYAAVGKDYNSTVGTHAPQYATTGQQLTAENFTNLLYACNNLRSTWTTSVTKGQQVCDFHFVNLENINMVVNKSG